MNENQISGVFKVDDIIPNQLDDERKIELMKDEVSIEQPEINLSEDEIRLLDIFQEFTDSYDLNLLIDCHEEFDKFTGDSYSILLENNFFDIFVDFMRNLRTPFQINPALEILLSFSDISRDITEQILGNFNNLLNCYLQNGNLYELYDLSLKLCINFSKIPSVAISFANDEIKISSFSRIYFYSPRIKQRQYVIMIYKNIAKFDYSLYDLFIESVLNEDFMFDILSLTETMKLLCYLQKKTGKNERFSSELFIENLKKGLDLAIKDANHKYIKNCLKFINKRCSNCSDAKQYYESGFSDIFIELPDEFMYYISLIYIGIFEKVQDIIEDSDLLEKLIERLDIMTHSGIYNHKVAAVKLISKIIFKRDDLSQDQTILQIVIDSLDLLLSPDLETVYRFLDLLITMCQWERTNDQDIVINELISNDISDLFDDISNNINELTIDNSKNVNDQLSIPDSSDVSNRIQNLQDLIFPQDESE